jgi:hypothetical protein
VHIPHFLGCIPNQAIYLTVLVMTKLSTMSLAAGPSRSLGYSLFHTATCGSLQIRYESLILGAYASNELPIHDEPNGGESSLFQYDAAHSHANVIDRAKAKRSIFIYSWLISCHTNMFTDERCRYSRTRLSTTSLLSAFQSHWERHPSPGVMHLPGALLPAALFLKTDGQRVMGLRAGRETSCKRSLANLCPLRCCKR